MEESPPAKLVYFFTRRSVARLTGRATERMIEPLEMYAHVLGLLRGYARLEQATAKLHRCDERLKNLAELKAATLTHCEYCIDFGSQVARRSGLSDEQLLALPSYRTSALFTDLEKLVLDYAIGMSRTPVEVSDALVASLRACPRSNRARLLGTSLGSPENGTPRCSCVIAERESCRSWLRRSGMR